jgi:hypothetical protein
MFTASLPLITSALAANQVAQNASGGRGWINGPCAYSFENPDRPVNSRMFGRID